ncbi:MAG: hypothetical protein WBC91_03200 [Phototrophicaceae bacterium]
MKIQDNEVHESRIQGRTSGILDGGKDNIHVFIAQVRFLLMV